MPYGRKAYGTQEYGNRLDLAANLLITINDALGLSDDLTRQVQRTLSDNEGMTDVVTTFRTILATIIDNEQLTDDQAISLFQLGCAIMGFEDPVVCIAIAFDTVDIDILVPSVDITVQICDTGEFCA